LEIFRRGCPFDELGQPIGFVTDKKVLPIQLSGGAYARKGPASIYIKTIFTFIRVSDFHELFAEEMDYAPESASQIMADAMKEAVTLEKFF